MLQEHRGSLFVSNSDFVLLLPELLDGRRGEVLLGDVVVVLHVLVERLVRRVHLEARLCVPPTLCNGIVKKLLKIVLHRQ